MNYLKIKDMYQIKFFILMYIMIFVNYSCKNPHTVPVKGEKIVFSGKKMDLIDTSFFANPRLVALETTDEALIRNIDAICAVEDTLFLLDKSQKKILIYDKKGRFIHTIQDIGNGPHEYVSISDICVHKKRLYVLCDNPRKIMQYNCRGQFSKEEQLPDWFNNLAVTDDKIYLYRNGSLGNNMLSVYTESNQSIQSHPVPKGRFINAEREGIRYSFSDGRPLTVSEYPLFTWPLDYTIYTIEKGVPKAKYSIDFGEKGIPQTLLEQNISPQNFLSTISKKRYICNMENIVENDDYLMFQTNPSIFLLDKQKKELMECFMIRNGMLRGGGHTGYLAVNGSSMIAQVYIPLMFKGNMDNLIKHNTLPKGKFTDEYLRVYKNLKEEDNPILCLYELPHK